MYSCGVIIWSKFRFFNSYYLVQVCFFENIVCQKHYKIGVSADWFSKKNTSANLHSYSLVQVGKLDFFLDPILGQILTLLWTR